MIGAGTTGATAGSLLRLGGHDVTLFERAAGPRVEGCGILLRGNALDALLNNGLHDVADAIIRASTEVSGFQFRNFVNDKVVRKVPQPDRTKRFSRMVRRADVLNAVYSPFAAALAAGDARAHFVGNAHAVAVEEGADSVRVSYERRDGARSVAGEWVGDLVVAADGIRSKNADRLNPGRTLHFLGDRVWRGIVEDDQVCTHGQFIVYQRMRGMYCNFLDLGPDGSGTHWTHWGAFRSQADKPGADEIASLGADARVPDEILELLPAAAARMIRRTERSRIVESFAYDAEPVSCYASDRVVLLGDAAHAMASTLAWGMSAGIEDAVELVACLRECQDRVQDALRLYERKRIPVTHEYQAGSRAISSGRTGNRTN